MYLTNEWYFFTEALSKETCNRIIKLGNSNLEAGLHGFEKGVIEKGSEITDKERIEGKKRVCGLNEKVRSSEIAWVNDQWLYDLIWPYMVKANELAGWKYDIKAAESLQITRYKKGGFYEFHKDGGSDNLSAYNDPKNKFLHGNVRKLSMSIILNDDYDGGDFQFAVLERENGVTLTPELNKLGSIIVFPSFITHRVKPITGGTRYSLVSWFLGPPFK